MGTKIFGYLASARVNGVVDQL